MRQNNFNKQLGRPGLHAIGDDGGKSEIRVLKEVCQRIYTSSVSLI